jgi:hypothetical protein
MKLGTIIDSAGLTKSNIKEGVKLGAGAMAFPFAWSFLQGQLLLRASPAMFAQGTAPEMALRAIGGVMLGSLVSKRLKQPAIGDGIVASAVGSVAKDIASRLMNPAAAAVQDAVTSAEQATGASQMSGISPLGRGLAGLRVGGGNFAATSRNGNPAMLFGVGTPNMSAAKMLSGATVAIEQKSNSGLRGATVAVQNVPKRGPSVAATFGV